MTPISVPGADAPQRAVSLAGALAEAAVTNLALASARGWTPLQARQTDLPSLLLEAATLPDAELLALDRPIRITLTTDAFLAFTTDAAFADALARAAASQHPHA